MADLLISLPIAGVVGAPNRSLAFGGQFVQYGVIFFGQVNDVLLGIARAPLRFVRIVAPVTLTRQILGGLPLGRKHK